MVLFIKGSCNDFESDTDKTVLNLCKQMANIENNKSIFLLNGDVNTSMTTFNQYLYNQVDYNIYASMGVLTLYLKNNITRLNLEKLFKRGFASLNVDSFSKTTHTCNGQYMSQNYTMTLYNNPLSAPSDNNYNNIRWFMFNDIGLCNPPPSCVFTWVIKVIAEQHIDSTRQRMYADWRNLQIAEYHTHLPKEYLMRSISTIIYDEIDLFNVKSGLKQINYPALTQYNAYKDDKLIKDVVYISKIYGLDREILSYYMKIYDVHCSIIDKTPFINKNDCKLRRVDLKKRWDMQIDELFDYDKQEDLESKAEEIGKPKFYNDICFISKMPLYGYNYVLKIGKPKPPKVSDTDTASTHKIEYENVSYIAISSMVYKLIFKIKKKELVFTEYFEKSKYRILKTYIIKSDRKESEAIDLIPAKKISKKKRHLLRCISYNGCCEYKNKLHTLSVKQKKIYIGHLLNDNSGCITDSDIALYKNTNTALFAYKLF